MKVRRLPRWVFVVAVVAVVALIVGSILWNDYAPGGSLNPYKVKVTGVDWLIDSQPFATFGGFTLKAGSTAELSVTLDCEPTSGFFGPSPQYCSSGSVTIETPGFSVSSTNAPFSWYSGDSGQNALVYVYVTLPNHSYAGDLVINLQ